MNSIEQVRRAVQKEVDRALQLVSSAGCKPAVEVEQRLWVVLLTIGRLLMTVYLTRQAQRWVIGRKYVRDGRRLSVLGYEEAQVGLRFGKVTFMRPVGRESSAARNARDLPLDRELGLPGGFSQPVVTTISRLCAQMSFAQARALFAAVFLWTPSPRAVLRMVDATAARAVAFSEQAEISEDDGEVLVIGKRFLHLARRHE